LVFLIFFVPEFTKYGVWRIKVIKLILWSVPLAVIAVTYIFLYSTIISGLQIFHIFASVGHTEIIIIAQVLLGYTISTSFYKTEEGCEL